MVFNAINKGLFARGIEGDLNTIPIDFHIIYNIDHRKSYLNFFA